MLVKYLGCGALGAAAAMLLVVSTHGTGWFASPRLCPPVTDPNAVPPAFAFVRQDKGTEGAEELRRRLDAARWVVFRSHDGIAYRTDDDWEITFGRDPDRTIDILHFGLGLEHGQGTYELREDGRVRLLGLSGTNFPAFPELMLQARHGALLLLPFSMSPDLVRDDTWYFRMLTGDDAQEALSDLRPYRKLD
jgi:hypothetical protein